MKHEHSEHRLGTPGRRLAAIACGHAWHAWSRSAAVCRLATRMSSRVATINPAALTARGRLTRWQVGHGMDQAGGPMHTPVGSSDWFHVDVTW